MAAAAGKRGEVDGLPFERWCHVFVTQSERAQSTLAGASCVRSAGEE